MTNTFNYPIFQVAVSVSQSRNYVKKMAGKRPFRGLTLWSEAHGQARTGKLPRHDVREGAPAEYIGQLVVEKRDNC